MKPFFYTLTACGFLALGSQARAQDSTTDTSTYGQLSALTGQIAILKAQAQVAQLQQQIADAKRSESASAAPAPTPVFTPTQAAMPGYPPGLTPTPVAPVVTDTKPQVISISGAGQRLTALLQMSSGGEVEAGPGTPLGNGMVVQYITPSSVQVMQNGQLRVLPFAGGGAYAPGG